MIHYRETPHGFEFGSARVERVASDENLGWVIVRVTTPKKLLDVYVTKTGKMRLILDGEKV